MTQNSKHGIFVVSDNISYLESIERALRSFYVIHVYSDFDAINSALRNYRPAAMIIDENFTPDGGLQFLEAIRRTRQYSTIPIVFTAKPNQTKTIATVRELPLAGILTKPYRASELLKALSILVDKHVAEAWSKLKPQQHQALQNTLDAYNSIADCISEGIPIPFSEIEKQCAPLIEVLQSGDYTEMLDAVREHDNYSYIHSFRVATFLTLFGRHYEIPDQDLPILAAGGLLHDIGKLSVPFIILNKPGKLNVEEWHLVQTHVSETLRMLEEAPDVPQPVKIIAGQHHERLDGSGYPKGLKEDQLNYLARIAAIIDVFCALTDRRAYKQCMSPTEAIEKMEDMRGHLDQHLLSQFKDMLLRTATEEGLTPTLPKS